MRDDILHSRWVAALLCEVLHGLDRLLHQLAVVGLQLAYGMEQQRGWLKKETKQKKTPMRAMPPGDPCSDPPAMAFPMSMAYWLRSRVTADSKQDTAAERAREREREHTNQ